MGSFTDRIGKKKQAAQSKISARLLEFAQPMIDHARERDGDPEPHQIESLLKVAVTIVADRSHARDLVRESRG